MRRFSVSVVSLAVVGLVLFAVFFLGFSSQIHMANLAWQNNEGLYLYTPMPAEAAAAFLNQGQAPMVVPEFEVLADDGVLYAQPLSTEPLVNALLDSLTLYPKPESGLAGYFTATHRQSWQMTSQFRPAAKVGQQLVEYTITIRAPQQEPYRIRWTLNTTTGVQEPLENCTRKTFRVVTNPAPGETVSSKQPFVVVPLAKLTQQLSKTRQCRWDEEVGLLYLEPIANPA